MKLMVKIVILLFVLLTPVMGACMGPIFTGPKTASWTAVPGASGYYVYYRAPGATGWPDSQRIQTNATSVDLVATGVPQGTWEVCATTFDSLSESGPSDMVTWSYAIKGSPGSFRIQ
jgi:hypothetical protein